MQQLIEKHLLQKTALYQLISDISCFLVHPNLWIRQVCIYKLLFLVFIMSIEVYFTDLILMNVINYDL